jgi:four helix bundle protein
MSREGFKARTKAYALRVIRLVDALPPDRTAGTIGQQLLRCGMSVAANYRAAVRSRSPADFVAKMGIVEEECDESLLWIEILVDSARLRARRVTDLAKEGHEILAITVASIKTARRGRDAFK